MAKVLEQPPLSHCGNSGKIAYAGPEKLSWSRRRWTVFKQRKLNLFDGKRRTAGLVLCGSNGTRNRFYFVTSGSSRPIRLLLRPAQCQSGVISVTQENEQGFLGSFTKNHGNQQASPLIFRASVSSIYRSCMRLLEHPEMKQLVIQGGHGGNIGR